jgi:uncharacterized membrane protein YqjE
VAGGDPAASGLLASLRRLIGGGAELLQVRLELFGTELEREKLRILGALMRAALALLLVGIGVVMLAAFIVVLWWEQHRLLALGTLTLVCLGGGAWLWLGAMERLKAPGGLFAASAAELAKDRAVLGEPPA